MEITPTEFDLIVLGTGLEESLVAAAASTSGLSVLHLDNEPEYGSQWAGLDVESFLARLDQTSNKREAVSSHEEAEQRSQPGTVEVDIDYPGNGIYTNLEIRHPSGHSPDLRQQIIDLAPKLFYTAGPLIDSLLRFKADNYMVFRLMRSFVWQDSQLLSVPASRADIFRSNDLSPASKRILMRFLKSTVDAMNNEGPLKDAFGPQPLLDVLDQEKLPPDLRGIIFYCLAMLTASQERPDKSQDNSSGVISEEAAREEQMPDRHLGDSQGQSSLRDCQRDSAPPPQCTASEGIKRMVQYVEAAGRHGSPFMAADYGSGELPQAFCRVAAVAGAVYVLRAGVLSLVLEPSSQRCQGVNLSNGQMISCKALAANSAYLPQSMVDSNESSNCGINRAVLITQRPPQSFDNPDTMEQCLAIVPPSALSPGNPAHPVRVLRLGSRSQAAPEGRHVIYLTTMSNGRKAAEQLEPVAEAILASNSELVMSVYYTQCQQVIAKPSLPANVALCQPPDAEVGFEMALARSEAAFEKLFSGQEFLPAAQNSDADSDDVDMGS